MNNNQHVYQAFQIASLIRKHHTGGSLSDTEQQALEAWLNAEEKNRKLFEQIIHSGDVSVYEHLLKGIDTDSALQQFKARYPLTDQSTRTLWRKVWPVAAAILVFLSIGLSWFYFIPTDGSPQALVSQYGDDVPAGGDRAILTLSDGRIVELSSDKQGVVIGDDLTYNDGTSLVDVTSDGDPQSIIELTLTTPRGGQYQTTLADGTKVWLNAGSSLRYPLHFSGKERVVTLEGEAYFDVSHDANRPFIVNVNDTKIEVLGTQFNVNSYTNITTTLVEGSVKIANTTGQQLLKPGQEARIGESITVHTADVNKVIAWKNGYFYFKSDNIVDIMAQLARWYDVEVKYEGTAPSKGYNGRIRREVNISKVLDMLAYLSDAQFAVAGKQITVTFK